MTRTYKLFKISNNKEKLVKEYPTMQEATYKVRSILGLKEFQKCDWTELFDGVMSIGMIFTKESKEIFVIRKEVCWDGQQLGL